MKITKAVLAEIEKIRQAKGGQLKQEDVIEASKRKKSPLYPFFYWDDPEKACQIGREEIARQLIMKVKVTFDPKEEKKYRVRTYVSLASDRLDGTGYRHIEDVMKTPDLRAELLQTALGEMEAFRRRYRHLTELESLWPILDELGRQFQMPQSE